MTALEQKKRSEVQIRCIRRYARIENVNVDEAGMLWCVRGLAKQWADYYD